MQPLSRVKPDARIRLGQSDTMIERPKLASNIAQCLFEYAEIESYLGLLLGTLIGAEFKNALAMYLAVENRAAQFRMVRADIETVEMPPADRNILQAGLLAVVTPIMRQRDKLAHWRWGYSPDLPEALLLVNPAEELPEMAAVLLGEAPSEMRRDHMYVVTLPDTERILERFKSSRLVVSRMASLRWKRMADKHDLLLHSLSSEPQIRAGLAKLAKQNAQEVPPSSPQPGPSE